MIFFQVAHFWVLNLISEIFRSICQVRFEYLSKKVVILPSKLIKIYTKKVWVSQTNIKIFKIFLKIHLMQKRLKIDNLKGLVCDVHSFILQTFLGINLSGKVTDLFRLHIERIRQFWSDGNWDSLITVTGNNSKFFYWPD